ncbi:hypothetical protein MNB_SM-7-688 [hydrothermal vent metagenome]|uniref:Uncharacterized protein n=1 Tax=hydrothermal vent metagenome TaxID=652676 RepID=A0A1W1C2R4_9ZZZZ
MRKLALSLITVGTLTLGMAATNQQTQTSILSQVEDIQNAPKEERVELMNQLKERIASMSVEERKAAMQELHQQRNDQNDHKETHTEHLLKKVDSMLTQMHHESADMQEHQNHMQNHVEDHAEHMQQNAHQEMERNEHMSQREAGEQHKEQMQGYAQEQVQEHTQEQAQNQSSHSDNEEMRRGGEQRR